MGPPARYWIPAAWFVLLTVGAMGVRDPVLRWALMFLTVALVVEICWLTVEFVTVRIRARRRGEPVLTESTLRGLLLAGLVVGFVLRVVDWNQGQEGLMAWIGGIMALVSLAGLLVLGYRGERRRATRSAFYFNPNWRYGLVLVVIATMVIAGLAGFEGVVVTVCSWLFWLAVIALIVQTVGRWVLRWRGREAGPRPAA